MSHATSTPAIRIHDSLSQHSRFATSRQTSHPPSPSIPMPIPNAREAPPPPLPPPRYINELETGQDPGWQWANNPNRYQSSQFEPNPVNADPNAHGLPNNETGDSIMYGNADAVERKTGDGSFREPARNKRSIPINGMSDKISKANKLESVEDGSKRPNQPGNTNYRLQSERQLGQISLENSSQAYDKQLLSKIGGPKASSTGFLAGGNPESSSNPNLPASSANTRAEQLPSLGSRQGSTEKPTQWAISATPGSSNNARGPALDAPTVSSVRKHSHGNTPNADEGVAIPRRREEGSDHGVFAENEFSLDENSIRDLNIEDRSPGFDDYQVSSSGALKRRASSPPSEASREERSIRASMNDLYNRRSNQLSTGRVPLVSKFHAPQGSISSVSSAGQKTGSYASSYGLSAASSLTSFTSERHLAHTLSPSSDGDIGPSSPFNTGSSLRSERRGSLPKARVLSESEPSQGVRRVSTETTLHARQGSLSRFQGHLICECCPKKPKKFDTEEELRAHESEKQYTCQFCSNRFKNKNEAERHQNSLHLRRYSWSCAALTNVHAAFHPSSTHPAEADTCGYCGENFPNPADWNHRSEHLNNVHKYGECNQAKKFFRADHFRQHLKHSHAGMSGKWTNLLENACMKEESSPKERAGPPVVGASAHLAQGHKNKPGMITESLDES